MVALAVATVATIAVVLPAVRARADVKGQLAESTSAQMAFMLLACAVGAPVVALTHLAGHALYKSARFLGAGDTIRHQVTRRRWLPAPTSLHLGAAAIRRRSGVVALRRLGGRARRRALARQRRRRGAGAPNTGTSPVGAGRLPVPLLTGRRGGMAIGVPSPPTAWWAAVFHGDAFVDPRLALLTLGALAGGTALLRRTPAGAAWLAGVTPVAAPAPARVAASVASAPAPVGARPAKRVWPRHAAGEPVWAPALEGAR